MVIFHSYVKLPEGREKSVNYVDIGWLMLGFTTLLCLNTGKHDSEDKATEVPRTADPGVFFQVPIYVGELAMVPNQLQRVSIRNII
jgi:hypothetical protein